MAEDKNQRLTLPESTWAEIRAASIRGVSDSQLALQYGVKPTTISTRRYNDRPWAIAKSEGRLATDRDAGRLVDVLSDSLETIATENPLLLAQYVNKKLKKSVSNDMLPEIESWSDAKTASEILRKACGLDKEQAAVSVNFWGGSSFDPAEMPAESATVETQDTSEEWI